MEFEFAFFQERFSLFEWIVSNRSEQPDCRFIVVKSKQMVARQKAQITSLWKLLNVRSLLQNTNVALRDRNDFLIQEPADQIDEQANVVAVSDISQGKNIAITNRGNPPLAIHFSGAQDFVVRSGRHDGVGFGGETLSEHPRWYVISKTSSVTGWEGANLTGNDAPELDHPWPGGA